MWATIVAVVSALYQAGWVTKGLVLLGALLFPSPIQKAIDKRADIKKAEDKASSTGDVTDLDKL